MQTHLLLVVLVVVRQSRNDPPPNTRSSGLTNLPHHDIPDPVVAPYALSMETHYSALPIQVSTPQMIAPATLSNIPVDMQYILGTGYSG